MKLLIQLLAAGLVCAAQAQGTFQAVTSYATSAGSTVTGTAGWSFQTTTNIQLNALGAFDTVVTSQGPIYVGLWASDHTLLASNSVTSASALVGATRYVPVQMVELAPNQTYYLGAYSPSGSLALDIFGLAPTTDVIVMSPIVQLVGAANLATGFGFPTPDPDGLGIAYLGPNFSFTLVPEPSSVALLGLGGLLLALRRKTA